jgi:hypothetical protein
MGDFNFKEINWVDQNTSVGTVPISSKFLEVVRDSFLFQHVKQPTRYRNENTPSLLDLVFTNEKRMIETIDHCSPLSETATIIDVMSGNSLAQSSLLSLGLL